MKPRSDPSAFNPEKFLKQDAAEKLSAQGRLFLDELMPFRWSRGFKADFIARLVKTTPSAFYAGPDAEKMKAATRALETEVAAELKELGIAPDSVLVRMLAWGCVADPLYRRAVRRLKPSA